MSNSKNETPALIAALVVTAALVGGAIWWVRDRGILSGGVDSVIVQPEGAAQSNSNGANSNGSGSNGASSSGGNSFSTAVENVPQGQFSYGGSTSWAPLRGGVDPTIQNAVPGFSLTYKNTSGSSDGIQKLIDGELDFAQSSRPLNSAERRRSQQKGIPLEEIPVMLEGVAVATHPELAIPGLTLTQLKDIYTGQLTNWNQVGGPNLAIQAASRSKDGGTVQFFQEDVLEGQAFGPSTKILGSTTEALRFVSNTPGAIYFASAPEIVGQCTVAPLPIGTSVRQLVAPYQQPYVPPSECPGKRNQLNLEAFQSQSYPLIRPLYVVIKQDDQPGEKAGRAYSELLQTAEGQGLLQQYGFVPLP